MARDRTPQQEGKTPALDAGILDGTGDDIRKTKPAEHATNTQPAKKEKPLNKTDPGASQGIPDHGTNLGGHLDGSVHWEDGDSQPSASLRTHRATAGNKDADNEEPAHPDASLRSNLDIGALDEGWIETASPHVGDQTADHRLDAPKCSSKPWHSDAANIKASGLFMTADKRVPDKPTIMKQWVQDQHHNSRTSQGA